MKIADALICLECDEVYRVEEMFNATQVCPSCSSRSHIRLSRFFAPLNKENEKPVQGKFVFSR